MKMAGIMASTLLLIATVQRFGTNGIVIRYRGQGRTGIGAAQVAAATTPATIRAHLNLITMPELPDIVAYIGALESRIVGQPLEHVRIQSAFLLRTVDPPIASVEGRVVREVRRIG